MAETATKPKKDKAAKAASKGGKAAAAPAKPKLPAKKERKPPLPYGPHGGIQLLLIDDVDHLGKMGDVVEVKPGYARNYLLPRGHATFVTPHMTKRLELHKIKVQKMREAKLADLRSLADQISRVTVTIEANANEAGHLFGSVGSAEIAKALKAQHLNVDPEAIRLEGQIKELALYAVKVVLAPEIETEVKVLVIGTATATAEKK